jgi:deoxyribodipyrimidine photo-lyase
LFVKDPSYGEKNGKNAGRKLNIVLWDVGIVVKHNIYWFRNNFRINDNHSLAKCIEESSHISFVVILNPKIQSINKSKSAKNKFFTDCVSNLDKKLKKMGHHLHIFFGVPHIIFEHLFSQNKINEIYCEEYASPYETNEINEINSYKVNTLWESSLISIDQLPFGVDNLPNSFTKFRKEVEKIDFKIEIIENEILSKPARLINSIEDKDQVKEINFRHCGSIDFLNNYSICEDGAQQFIKDYFSSDKASYYKETRNELSGINFSTKFSIWLGQGLISARQIYKALKEYELINGENESTYWIYFELLWRDFFRFLHLRYGKRLYFKFGLKDKLDINIENIENIENGETPSKFINSAIRELKQSGFLSNRMRQILASYIIYDMRVDWRWGANFYQTYLVDFDIYSNQGNWIYIAGYGTDPRGGRRFNVEKQKNMYDLDNQYELRWNENA